MYDGNLKTIQHQKAVATVVRMVIFPFPPTPLQVPPASCSTNPESFHGKPPPQEPLSRYQGIHHLRADEERDDHYDWMEVDGALIK